MKWCLGRRTSFSIIPDVPASLRKYLASAGMQTFPWSFFRSIGTDRIDIPIYLYWFYSEVENILALTLSTV